MLTMEEQERLTYMENKVEVADVFREFLDVLETLTEKYLMLKGLCERLEADLDAAEDRNKVYFKQIEKLTSILRS